MSEALREEDLFAPPDDVVSVPEKGKAVVGGVLQFTSPSQLSQFADCPRKWWFRRVLGLPERPEGPAIQWGKEGHKELEVYLKGGDRPQRSDIVRGMACVPEPSPAALVEGRLVDDLAGVPLVLVVDHAQDDGPEVVVVRDWKFPKNDRYLPADLAAEVPMALYGRWFLRRGAPRVRLEQVYFLREVKKTLVTSSRPLGAAELAPAVAAAAASARHMRALAAEAREEAVPANTRSCDKYAGCDYRDRCAAARFDPLEHITGGREMGFVDELKKKLPGAQAQAPDPAALARLERKNALPADQRAAVVYLANRPEGKPAVRGRAAQVWAASSMIDPPESGGEIPGRGDLADVRIEDPADLVVVARELQEHEASGGDAPVPTTDAERAAAQQHPASASPPDAPPSRPADHVGAEEAKKEKRKTRAAKARGEEPPAAAVREPDAAPAAPADTRGETAAAAQSSAEGLEAQRREAEAMGPMVLVLVNCALLGAQAPGVASRRLEPWVRDVADKVAVAFQVPDVRLADGGPLGYNRWKVVLEDAFCLAAPGLEAGPWLLDCRDELGECAVAGLVRAGVMLCRGYR